jgi:hypothetical protein
MLNGTKLIVMLSISLLFAACSSQNSNWISISNPTNLNLTDALIETSIDPKIQNISLTSDDGEIPFQLVDEDGKRILKFVTDLNPNQKKEIRLEETTSSKSKEFKSRTYAELSMKANNVYFDKRFRGNKFENVSYLKVPAIHTDHDALFKYEGPGWESEKVGYRFYLDWRNATDIFGKKYDKLILDQVGTHDTVAKDDSYHSMQEWGMDIFKVGSSLGIGSIGMLADDKVNMVSKIDSVICSIPYTGPIEAKVNTKYYGWLVGDSKYDLNSNFSISAGSRLTKCELQISKDANNIVTGLAKYKGTELMKSNFKSGWNYLALYGKQTLVNENDKLGIVVFYKSEDLLELNEDELSYIVKLKPNNGNVTYYFAAAWEQEENGIKKITEFKKYLDETLITLNNPVIVEIK